MALSSMSETFDAVRGVVRAIIRPGMPTTTAWAGTDPTTTALAPMRLSSDGDRPQNLGPGTDGHPVANGRMTFPLIKTGSTEGDALVDGHVVTDLGCLADNHSVGVVDEDARAERGGGVDLDAREQSRQRRARSGGQLQVPRPQPVVEAVGPQGVDAGIGQRAGHGILLGLSVWVSSRQIRPRPGSSPGRDLS